MKITVVRKFDWGTFMLGLIFSLMFQHWQLNDQSIEAKRNAIHGNSDKGPIKYKIETLDAFELARQIFNFIYIGLPAPDIELYNRRKDETLHH